MTKLTAIKTTALCAFMLVAGAAKAETSIIFNSFFPPQHFLTRDVMRDWAKDVERITDGRVVVRIPASTAAPPPELWDAVDSGIVDGTYIYNGFAEDRITLPLVAHLPWLGTGSAEAMSVSLWRTYEKHFQQVGEYEGVKLIGLFTAPGGELYGMGDEPILSVSSLRQRKIWALPGTTATLLRGLDVPIVSGPAVQIHEYVSVGVVDGFAGIPLIDADSFKALRQANSVTEFPRKITTPSFSMFISERKWQEISPEDRQAIMSVSGEALARKVGRAFDKANARVKAQAREDGVEFVEGNAAFYEQLQTAGEPLVEEWKQAAEALGVKADSALDYYRSQLTAN